MQSNKEYSNVTFTKRVDHERNIDKSTRLSEPSICSECGLIKMRGRWYSPNRLPATSKNSGLEHKTPTICPACDRVRRNDPRGYLTVDGDFVRKHSTDIQNLLSNEADRAAKDNPLARIVEIAKLTDRILVKTTTDHFAQRLGHALKKAFDGQLSISFSHENHLTRVAWHRE